MSNEQGELADDASERAADIARPGRRRWRLRMPKPTLAQSGFLLSVTLALINAGYAIRGSAIVVEPLQQIVLYRDGEGDRAVLTFATRLAMINADASHGDVLLNAEIAPAGGSPSFEFSSEIKPVFTSARDNDADCPIGIRCLALDGMMVIEQPDEILDIAGGGVRAATLAFPLVEWNCTGEAKQCSEFADFPLTVKKLAGKPLDVTVTIALHSDGIRTLRCATRPIDAAYLRQKGWMTMRCRNATVKGEPLF